MFTLSLSAQNDKVKPAPTTCSAVGDIGDCREPKEPSYLNKAREPSGFPHSDNVYQDVTLHD